ncbi:thioesterase family protein [Oceanicoccus sp. KOV_DT_Chl]|uniref:acyl-CoA thioesterase n=1 Tax=Oceanicoccus sp. KOV_DT_Chl TaxID=1904639 RepID=UPI000C7DFE84|nr:thioesterase family protein [Oceanicoccus sp. KOV_DT_Chl]
MPKIDITFPAQVLFSTDITVHDSYINRGNHVGNSRYVDLCNEATLRFFRSRNTAEYTIANQVLLNSGFSVQLKTEAKYADVLTVELGVDNFHRCGCDFIYKIENKNSDRVIALASLSFLSFDYQLGKVVDASAAFRDFFKVHS